MTRSHPLRVLVLVTLLLSAGCTAGVPRPGTSADTGSTNGLAQGVSVAVVEVTDGDTMDVRFPDGSTETVRLLGVDTPELHAENSPDEWDAIPTTTTGSEWLSRWGQRASEFATERLAGETVEIRTDPEADHRGGYGRLLVYLSLPGAERSFNRQLLDRGYARLYDTPFSRRDAFAAAEAHAQQSGTGVWGFSSGTTDTAPATQQSSLVLVEIHDDAAGNDHENLDDEYLVFENRRATRSLRCTHHRCSRAYVHRSGTDSGGRWRTTEAGYRIG